ncbi:MAG: serine hydrolase [Gemmataceae bacterium]
MKKPEEAGLDPAVLTQFSRAVGGRGCVVRHGYLVHSWGDAAKPGDVASAAKPVYAHFLWKAREENKIAGLDDPVVKYAPALGTLNGGLAFKDREITWRHLATQTSCYGVSEPPGKAFDYSDHQMALFWDLLFEGVRSGSDRVDAGGGRPEPGREALGCQDGVTMLAMKSKAGGAPGRSHCATSPGSACSTCGRVTGTASASYPPQWYGRRPARR